MKTLSFELSDPRLFGDDESFAKVAESVAAAILSDKDAEFHSLGLTLGLRYEGSSIVATEPGRTRWIRRQGLHSSCTSRSSPAALLARARRLTRPSGLRFQPDRRPFVPVAKSIMGAADQLGLPLCGVDLGAGRAPGSIRRPSRARPTRPARHLARRPH